MPYYIRDPERDHKIDNHPSILGCLGTIITASSDPPDFPGLIGRYEPLILTTESLGCARYGRGLADHGSKQKAVDSSDILNFQPPCGCFFKSLEPSTLNRFAVFGVQYTEF